MRPGKKALAAFVASHDVDELLDGHDFASRVVRGLHDDMGYFRSTDPEPGARGGDARDRVERLQRIHQGAFKSGAQAWGLGVRWSVGPLVRWSVPFKDGCSNRAILVFESNF